ncbi:MAG: hypothetical protein ACTHLW_10700 [Verrucomicrobiota bacterium]
MPADFKSNSKSRSGTAAYEKRDASAKWIFGIIGFLFLVGMIMHFVLAGMVERWKKNPTSIDPWTGLRRQARASSAPTPFPRLQISPPTDLAEFRAREDAELHTYGWINRTSGVVRIPIERAIDLLAQSGLPTRAETSENQLGPSSYQLQQRKAQGTGPKRKGEQ